MDGSDFDALSRALVTPGSRRRAMVVAGAVLGLALGATSVREATAKKKKRCPSCKKRKNGKCRGKQRDGTACAGGTCQSGHCVAALSPPPTATVRCDFSNGFVTAQRFAQTFIAPRSGSPTTAEVVLVRNPDDFALTFEIRTVLESGFPSTSVVYASSVVSDIPQTINDIDPPRRVVASFASVTAPLMAGQPYALVVSGSELWQMRLHSGGNACPGGKMFLDPDDAGPFLEHAGGDSDMVFALTIAG